MKTLVSLLSLALLLSTALQAQSIDELREYFPSYELDEEVEDAKLIAQLDKTIPKNLVKAFLLDDNGAYYETELSNESYNWHPLAHVAVNDKLDVFVVANGEEGTLASGTLVEFVTVYKGRYQDDVLVDGTIGGYLEEGIALIYNSTVIVSEDHFQVNEYSYQTAGVSESYESLKAQVEEKGDYRELVYQINGKGKISE